MLSADNKYSQKQLLLNMEEIAGTYDADMREMFKPLLLARKTLSKKCGEDAFDEWIGELKELHDKLDTNEVDIIYRVLAILFYKHEADITAQKHSIEDIIDGIDLNIVCYYDHYYNEEMQVMAIRAKAIEMLDKRNKILMDIAESTVSPHTRIMALKALDSYINSCLLPQSPNAINVYGQTAIDLSQNKQVAAFNIDELMGQGDDEFRKYLRSKKSTNEVEEIRTIENASN